jgi:hypothetical protein
MKANQAEHPVIKSLSAMRIPKNASLSQIVIIEVNHSSVQFIDLMEKTIEPVIVVVMVDSLGL